MTGAQLHLFEGEDSPLRENPGFRRKMEEYVIFDNRIKEIETRRGICSYDELLELKKLKKLRLALKDEMEFIKRHGH